MLPPPMMSEPAMAYATSYLDVDRRREGVVLDELATELDDVAHQHREDPICRRRVLHRDLGQRAGRGIHRRLAQLLGVHLAQALEAVEDDTRLAAHDVEDRVAQRLERQRLV